MSSAGADRSFHLNAVWTKKYQSHAQRKRYVPYSSMGPNQYPRSQAPAAQEAPEPEPAWGTWQHDGQLHLLLRANSEPEFRALLKDDTQLSSATQVTL